ncbi:MAG: Kae1-associated serine/threonine protein kinase [Thermoplasmata archaeon]|nr:Kae1-associated serine/threonine protein kinase [Thermoplasmata archaeon]
MDDETAASTPPTARGAEASLRRVDWMGFPALLKERETKAYRPKALDERLRKERTRTEVRLLQEARRLGVRTPIVYDVDIDRSRIVLEELPGPTLKELLEKSAGESAPLAPALHAVGFALGRLHAGGITQGDLTSSNILFPSGAEGPPAFIDLSMGARSAGVEEMGIDLHLIEEDLTALHPKGPQLYKRFLEGYAEGNPAGHLDVRTRAKAIKGRIRYA